MFLWVFLAISSFQSALEAHKNFHEQDLLRSSSLFLMRFRMWSFPGNESPGHESPPGNESPLGNKSPPGNKSPRNKSPTRNESPLGNKSPGNKSLGNKSPFPLGGGQKSRNKSPGIKSPGNESPSAGLFIYFLFHNT